MGFSHTSYNHEVITSVDRARKQISFQHHVTASIITPLTTTIANHKSISTSQLSPLSPCRAPLLPPLPLHERRRHRHTPARFTTAAKHHHHTTLYSCTRLSRFTVRIISFYQARLHETSPAAHKTLHVPCTPFPQVTWPPHRRDGPRGMKLHAKRRGEESSSTLIFNEVHCALHGRTKHHGMVATMSDTTVNRGEPPVTPAWQA